MSDKVLLTIFDIYKLKTNLFKNERMDLFKKTISTSIYRRCIINEKIMLEDNVISIV